MLDFHLKNKILRLLGTLWSRNYRKNGPCLTTAEANSDLLSQEQIDLQELIDCADRHTVPIWHVERWLPVILREKDAKTGFAYPILPNLRELPLIFNRITVPSLAWCAGLDYSLSSDGWITCSADPFETSLVPTTGEKGAREAFLWGFGAKIEQNFLSDRFGYLLNIEKPSSQGYKDLLNAIFDLRAYGTDLERFSALVHVLLGVPLAQNADEVVEGLYFDAEGPLLATDVQVYRIPSDATAAVLRGHRLQRAEPVVRWAQIIGQPGRIALRAPKSIDTGLLREYLPPDVELVVD